MAKNSLHDLEITAATELERRRFRQKYPQGGRTRIAKDVRSGVRKKPPVPKNKALSEVKEMDAEDKAFRHPTGRPRKWDTVEGEEIVKDEDLTWHERIRRDKQRIANARRAKARKSEALIVSAVRELETHVSKELQKEKDIYDEEKMLAESILDFDDWDNEELARGYRRNRKGNFGVAPRFIPREVQQAAFRLLVGRGDRKLKEAYTKSIEALIDLAHTADSEKVRLEAIKELMNRVVGKVPDTLLVAREEPWEGVLADSMVPLSETPPLEMEMGDDGVARLPYMPELTTGDGAKLPADLAVGPVVDAPPSPDTQQADTKQVNTKSRSNTQQADTKGAVEANDLAPPPKKRKKVKATMPSPDPEPRRRAAVVSKGHEGEATTARQVRKPAVKTTAKKRTKKRT